MCYCLNFGAGGFAVSLGPSHNECRAAYVRVMDMVMDCAMSELKGGAAVLGQGRVLKISKITTPTVLINQLLII